jgi:hypothetical protein
MIRYAVLPTIAVAMTLGLAPAAHADTHYGGTGLYKQTSPASPALSLIRRDDGRIQARVNTGYRCGGWADTSVILKGDGRLQGANFALTARKRVRGVGTIRVTLTGTVADFYATGEARIRVPRCKLFKVPFVVRSESAPAGAPAVPAPGTLMQGFTSQLSGGFRSPLGLRVAKNGKVYGMVDGTLRCGRARISMLDYTPTRTIKADGTFGGTQTYTVRYKGFTERFSVSFRGQFLADGARGTLTASMQLRDGKRRYVPCRTGRQTWTARAT